MRLRNHLASALCFALVLSICALSCSKSSDPLSPTIQNPDIRLPATQQNSNRVLFGAWILSVSQDHSSIDVMPVRTPSGHFNIRTFLEDGPCTDCLSIVGVSNQGNNVLDVDIRITHPFPGLDKFTGFDVRGIAIFPWSMEWPENNLLSSGAEGGAALLNPDGWTSLFNPDIQNPQNVFSYQPGKFAHHDEYLECSLNPYKAFYYEPNRRPFFTDDVITKTYSIKIPPGPFHFGYAVDASWELPDPNPPENVPDDFPIDANSLEAYKISAHVSEGLTESSGSATCEIDVYDWQGTSTISLVSIEAPHLFDGILEAFLDTDFGTISRWTLDFQNEKNAPEGDWPVLIRSDDINSDPVLGPNAAFTVIMAHVDQAPVLPDGIYVDRDYPGIAGGLPENGTPEAPFTTINKGILMFQPGQKVFVDPSPEPYNEQVYINKDNCFLLGDNWRDDGDFGKPVIEAMESDISVYGLAASDITIDNFEIRPGGDLWAEFLYGIQLDYIDPYEHQQNATIRNCLFTGDRVHTGNNYGDEIMCCEVILTDNFLFEDNVITEVHVGSDQGGYFGGLHVDVCDGVTIRRNRIFDCTTKNSFLGMHVWYSDEPVLIEDNEVGPINNSDAPSGFTIGWGINVISYSDVTVRHNVVHDFGSPGHRLETIPLFFRVSGNGSYENWSIENNLMYNMYAQDADNNENIADCRGLMFRMNESGSLDGLRIANNTIDRLTSGHYVTGMEFDIGSSDVITNYAIENNIITNVQGPAQPESLGTSAVIFVWWSPDDLFIDYSLFDGIDIPDPDFAGVILGDGIIMDQDPMFDPDWHYPIDSPAQLGNPTYLDFDDPGPASGDPDDPDPETRSRMGSYGGHGGDW